jgi:N-formylglutamate deformylase
LTAAVERAVALGSCILIDAHSFPSRPLPYELDQRLDRPDICIGTDPFHTPTWLRDVAVSAARAAGWSVSIDRPFSGSLVPQAHYRRDRHVASVMIEVNRALYMDETTGARSTGFAATRDQIEKLIAALWGKAQAR